MAVEQKVDVAPVLIRFEEKLKELTVATEKMKLAEYVELLDRPWRLMYVNFIAGLARGVGIAVGFTLLGALLIYFLKNLVAANLPGIGKFIAEVVRMVNLHLY
ncbi:MAG: DUF5665 domain-containing protein [Bacillota bacterium]